MAKEKTEKPKKMTPEEIDRQIQINHLNNEERQIEIDENRCIDEYHRTLVEQVNCLGHLLTIMKPDEAKSMPGSESVWELTFDDDEVKTIKSKLFELINKF